MDEIRQERLRQAKNETADWLETEGQERIALADLERVDLRLTDYLYGVARNPEGHNLWELLAVRRFLLFLERYTFSVAKAQRVIGVLETLKFVSAEGMRPLKLSPVQVFLLASIYGFYLPDGRRLTRNAMLFVPRKFGKTTLVAGLAVYELLFGDADGQVYACANSYAQAKIMFDNVRHTIRVLDPGGTRFKVNREAIYNMTRGHSSFAKCLASDASTLDGLSASFYVLDEFSQSKSAELRNVMSTSTGVRNNPLELIITTASDVIEGPCFTTLESYKSLLLDELEDDSVFALIFEPDVDDKEDDPATWRKVQPHLGVTVKDDYYEQKWKQAQLTAENMLAFRNKLLNIFAVNEEKAWITGQEVRRLFRPFNIDKVSGQPYCMVAIDLSVWDDFSCVTYGIYSDATASFHFHSEYYLPEDRLEKHAYRDLYRTWVEKGWLRLLPGEVLDYQQVCADIIRRNGAVRILGIGYDPYRSATAVNTLASAGAASVLKPIKQTYGTFTGPVETLEMMIKQGACTFSENEITAWCFGNCVMDEDRMGNRKPIKRMHSLKIDGAITTLMCVEMFNTFKR